MSRTTIGRAVIVAGLVIAATALFADEIGLGDQGDFGWKQILGVFVGAVLAVGGYLATRRGDAAA